MFSGVGGFELGIQNAWESRQSGQLGSISNFTNTEGNEQNEQYPTCIGYSEIDKYAIKVYERQFNGHKNYGDATKINEKELVDFDLLVGGFPCQAFSIAGKRNGFADTRGTLFFDIARILAEKRPRHLVLENVKGLLSHEQGKTFQTILGVLSDLGYRVEWQVLNSKDFGVPQNRERIYFVGHLRGECSRQVFPITRNNPKALDEHTSNQSQGFRVYDTDGIATTQASQAGGLGAKTGLYAMRGRENGQQLEPSGDFTNTITSVVKDNLWLNEARIRRLTPLECERLQGFPDNWTAEGRNKSLCNSSCEKDHIHGIEPISDTQRYKMCGNAVTVNVVEAVMERLFE